MSPPRGALRFVLRSTTTPRPCRRAPAGRSGRDDRPAHRDLEAAPRPPRPRRRSPCHSPKRRMTSCATARSRSAYQGASQSRSDQTSSAFGGAGRRRPGDRPPRRGGPRRASERRSPARSRLRSPRRLGGEGTTAAGSERSPPPGWATGPPACRPRPAAPGTSTAAAPTIGRGARPEPPGSARQLVGGRGAQRGRLLRVARPPAAAPRPAPAAPAPAARAPARPEPARRAHPAAGRAAAPARLPPVTAVQIRRRRARVTAT
jgi:pyruvate/2-oxoglutarate dehydrogenase complex dihydrolipoamide acyltransferase (E2) component